MSPEFRFKTGIISNRVSFSYGSSISDYNNSEFITQNIRFRYNGNLDNGYSFFYNVNQNDYEKETRSSYTIGAAKKFQQKGNISASLGMGDKMESNLSAFVILPWKVRLNTSLAYYRLSRFSFRYKLNISRNF